MAKKKATEGEEATSSNGGPPEGFTIKAEKMRGDGWMKKEPGNTLCGRLIGMFYKDTEDGPKPVFYVKIIEPCLCTVGAGEDAHEEILEKGAVVNAEGAIFADMARYVGNGGVYDVWFKYRGKEKLQGGKAGRTMWQGDGPYMKCLKEPPVGWEKRLVEEARVLKTRAHVAHVEQGGGADDDMPF